MATRQMKDLTRCRFGRPHVWGTWYKNAKLVINADTLNCHVCGAVQLDDGTLTTDQAASTTA